MVNGPEVVPSPDTACEEVSATLPPIIERSRKLLVSLVVVFLLTRESWVTWSRYSIEFICRKESYVSLTVVEAPPEFPKR